ncbi:fibronectin type III domain-containing protein [Candidatus Woesearchaeota archaeon]|nr:fibronectin type III domain-containing protein [Candidatus Woesearchaeota archaeon]
MKKVMLLLMLVSAALLSSACEMTGNIVWQDDQTAPLLTIGNVRILDTEATFEWTTDETSTSVFSMGSDSRYFEEATSFETTITGLQPNTRYDYQISACDRFQNCAMYKKYFVTALERNEAPQPEQEEPVSQITGAVVSVDAVEGMKSVAIALIYALLGIAVMAVVVRATYTKVSSIGDPTERKLKREIGEAEKMLSSDVQAAYQPYKNARALYSQLTASQQAKYYDRLVAAYLSLAQHSKAKEAHALADKYIAGTITKREIERLRELLT